MQRHSSISPESFSSESSNSFLGILKLIAARQLQSVDVRDSVMAGHVIVDCAEGISKDIGNISYDVGSAAFRQNCAFPQFSEVLVLLRGVNPARRARVSPRPKRKLEVFKWILIFFVLPYQFPTLPSCFIKVSWFVPPIINSTTHF